MTSETRASGPRRVQSILNKELGWFGIPAKPKAAQLIEQSDLPREVRDVIRQVVKRTRLRRGEKRDVARELCAHFSDGLESGATAKDLIRLFGDVKAAAKLIRRGKLRNRGIIWKSWIAMRWGALGVVGVFLCAYLIFAVRLAMSERVISRDYLAEFNAPALAVPVEERGWTILQTVKPVLDDERLYLDRDPSEIGYRDLIDARPGDAVWDEAVAFLREHAKAVETIHRAAAAPQFAYVAESVNADRDDSPTRDAFVEDSLIFVLLSHLGRCRQASQLLALDARRAIDESDSETFVRNVLAMRRLATGVAEYPAYITGLVGIAISDLADQVISNVLLERPEVLSDEQWMKLAHSSAAVSARALLRQSVIGERAFFYDTIQRVYTDDGDGDGLLNLRAMHALFGPIEDDYISEIQKKWPRSKGLGPIAAAAMPNRTQMVEAAERIFSLANRKLHTPKWEWDDIDVEAEINKLHAGSVNHIRYALIGIFLTSIESMAATQERTMQKQDAMKTAIALELYRRAHGEWPARLEALAPEYLPSVPLDGFTGRTLGYVVREGSPVLYSVGCDLEDNGGVLGSPHWQQEVRVGAWISRERREELKKRGHFADVGDWILWPPQKD